MHDHGPGPSHPPYPAGLLLVGRRVVVVGGGRVARRRIRTLLEAGARVHVVAPDVLDEIRDHVRHGRVSLAERGYVAGDLDGAWYAMAATDDPSVNEAVVAEAEGARMFCVRADDALRGTAWTPASGHHGAITVAVMANRDPETAAATRDTLMRALEDGAGG